MKSLHIRTATLVSTVVLAAFGLASPSYAVDADAAQALLKKNECTKCHSVDKDKKGPSYKKVAAKYKGKADSEEKVTKSLTTSPKVKLDDGTEEEHKALKADAPAMKNLVQWILAQ